MLKGVNKKVVEVDTLENEYFEKAILFIKVEKQGGDERTLKQRAEDYLYNIKYTPRTKMGAKQLLWISLKFSSAVALGAVLASFFIK